MVYFLVLYIFSSSSNKERRVKKTKILQKHPQSKINFNHGKVKSFEISGFPTKMREKFTEFPHPKIVRSRLSAFRSKRFLCLFYSLFSFFQISFTLQLQMNEPQEKRRKTFFENLFYHFKRKRVERQRHSLSFYLT